MLACAKEGQQRPELAASADLIKGAVRAWLRPAPGRPRSARIAVRLMGTGAAAQVAALITVILTAGSVRSAVAHRYPGVAAAQHAVSASLVMDYVGATETGDIGNRRFMITHHFRCSRPGNDA